MSYYIYKQKQFINVNGKIFPIVKYADSSVRTFDGKRYYSWSHFNITDKNQLLIPKEEWEKERTQRVNWDLDQLRNCNFITGEPNMDSYNYSGNRYPGGSRIKHLNSFLSTRRTISLDEFIRKNMGGFGISVSYFDYRTYGIKGNHEEYSISNEKELIDADQKFQMFVKNKPDNCGICIGLEGIIL